jgi:hypothetical protein
MAACQSQLGGLVSEKQCRCSREHGSIFVRDPDNLVGMLDRDGTEVCGGFEEVVYCGPERV